jgi:hypothetical protein
MLSETDRLMPEDPKPEDRMPEDPMPEPRLARVIYRSHSVLSDATDDRAPAVAEILRVARRNNAQDGLTGVLLFDGVNFLQAIEGDSARVEGAYERIACDLRHEDLELIEFKPITERDYRGFPMAYVEGLAAERETLRHLLPALTARHAADIVGDAVPPPIIRDRPRPAAM